MNDSNLTERELRWVRNDDKRQKFYLIITITFFLLMIYAVVMSVHSEFIKTPIYMIAFLFSFQAFMAMCIVITKTQSYIEIIHKLLGEDVQQENTAPSNINPRETVS